MIGTRTCSIGIAALAFTAVPAFAAGLEGAYWGVNVGGFMAETETDQSIFKPITGGSHVQTVNGFNSLHPTIKQTSVTGGVQAGYNWRAGPIILGAEVDMNYWRYRSQESATTSFVAGGGAGNTRTLTSTNMAEGSLLMTLRPRLGYMISERSLVYVSAGVAYTDLKYSNYSRAETSGGNGVTTQYFSQASADPGKVFGLGFEQVWSERMVVRIDYQNVTFDRVTSNGSAGIGFNDLANSVLTTGYKTNVHIVRLGANWRF